MSRTNTEQAAWTGALIQSEPETCMMCAGTELQADLTGLTSPYSSKEYSILRCGSCSHLQTSPYPTTEELEKIYEEVYNYDAHICIINEKRNRARRLLNWLEKSGMSLRGKRLLEIGCMFGNLLEESSKCGMDARGIELSSSAAEFGRQNGLNIECAPIEEALPKYDWKPDIVVLSHVLEHLRDPKELIENIRKLTGDSAWLVIAVPNNTSTLARILGKRWAWWQVPVHLNHFNDVSLRSLLLTANYTITAERYFCGDSLMFLLSALNCIGRAPKRGESKKFSSTQRAILSTLSNLTVAAYPLLSRLFDDEITVLAKPIRP